MRLAIIPARGGSKRIPRKNIREFCGKPIIAYSIEAAQKAGCFDRIIVSTDDQEIADIAEYYGAEVPFIRPDELANDQVGIGPVIEHTLSWLASKGESVEYICNILPTAPLLQPKSIQQGYELLANSEAANALSVTSMPAPIFRSFEITKDQSINMFWPEHYLTRSQDLPEAYYDAGQFCWTNLSRKPKHEYPFSDDSIPIVIPRHYVQDIDTEEDWVMAEVLYKVLVEMQLQPS